MTDFETYLQEQMEDPAFAAAWEAADQRHGRAVSRLCPFGNCTVEIDSLDGKIIGAFGPVGCGCDNLPGWRSERWDGLPKPGWQVKARGRHGSRIAASRRKHAELARWWREIVA